MSASLSVLLTTQYFNDRLSALSRFCAVTAICGATMCVGSTLESLWYVQIKPTQDFPHFNRLIRNHKMEQDVFKPARGKTKTKWCHALHIHKNTPTALTLNPLHGQLCLHMMTVGYQNVRKQFTGYIISLYCLLRTWLQTSTILYMTSRLNFVR
jgi:hypothetical protein